MNSDCNICSNSTSKIFDTVLLRKYNVNYFQCQNCGFIQTEKPYWLQEAYVSAITSIDVGLIYRNIYFSNIVPFILDIFSNEKDAYIDYGGGYGMFVRIMRDKGYNYFLHDMYAENLFAKYFDMKDYAGTGKFAALTAFEVFEHLEDPVEELGKMLNLSDTVIFSTDLQPASTFASANDWWYFTPETGQHISFYSKKSLAILGEKCDCKFYTNGLNLHMLTRENFLKNPFKTSLAPRKTILEKVISRVANKIMAPGPGRTSLLEQDFQLYKRKVNI